MTPPKLTTDERDALRAGEPPLAAEPPSAQAQEIWRKFFEIALKVARAEREAQATSAPTKHDIEDPHS